MAQSKGLEKVLVERDLDAVAADEGDSGGGVGGAGGGLMIFNPNERLSLGQQRMNLPIYKYRTHILYLVEKYPTTIIVGHTGCGKTTQIPQYLHESGWTGGNRVVACTQPRRIAASSVAARVAEETGKSLGQVR